MREEYSGCCRVEFLTKTLYFKSYSVLLCVRKGSEKLLKKKNLLVKTFQVCSYLSILLKSAIVLHNGNA